MSVSTWCLNSVSEISMPAMKAPSARLRPAFSVSQASASVTSSRLSTNNSSLLRRATRVSHQRMMRWWLTLVARRKSDELFVLNLLLVTLALAWLTEKAGLSLALGAFIAGMLISETEFKHQVETDIRPFHDVLLGLFFISVGMLLDWRMVLDRWGMVLVLLTLPVLFKLLLVI